MKAQPATNIESIFFDEADSSRIRLRLLNTPPVKTGLDVPMNQFIKRVVDLLLGGFLAIAILPWLIPVVAILIKLDSPGPVFFLQKRTGMNLKTFQCIKFRSMVVNKDADRLQVSTDDKRITKLGYYLRKFYIDEFPQLINIVWGDMSLVGPRPHMLRHNVVYARVIEEYHERHRVRPGLSGLAQMRGYHGMIAKKEDLVNRVAADLEYIETWSLFGDIRIFFNTIFVILKEL